MEQEWRKERKKQERNEDKKGDLESRSRVRKEKTHGEQEWSKEGKGDLESRSGLGRKRRYLESRNEVRKEKETWGAGVE
jgi:hypothetical protein